MNETPAIKTDFKENKEQSTTKKILGIFHRSIREFIALLFWIYVFSKLFIFDIDVLLLKNISASHLWILNYKFFILIGALAVIWLFTKNKYILIWSSYILFYPIIILAWKIPYFVFKQKSLILAFALINSIISFFKSVKYIFITSSIFLLSLCIIFSCSNKYLLWLSIVALLVVIFITYLNRFILIFKPSTVFRIHSKIVSGLKTFAFKTYSLDADIKNLPREQFTDKQLDKWSTNLQFSILFNRGCYFVAKKLRDYQNSRINMVSYAFNLFLLILLTVFSFAAINFGLFKIDPSLYSLTESHSFFNFFFYSFNNFIFNSIPSIIPTAPFSKVALMIEEFFSLFLGVILVTLIFSTKNEKHSNELNEVIINIKKQAEEMESHIKDEYNLPIENAIKELEKVKTSLVKSIYWFSKYIE